MSGKLRANKLKVSASAIVITVIIGIVLYWDFSGVPDWKPAVYAFLTGFAAGLLPFLIMKLFGRAKNRTSEVVRYFGLNLLFFGGGAALVLSPLLRCAAGADARCRTILLNYVFAFAGAAVYQETVRFYLSLRAYNEWLKSKGQ